MKNKDSIQLLIKELVNEEVDTMMRERSKGYNTFLPGFGSKREKSTVRLDRITEYEEVIQMIEEIKQQLPHFTNHNVVDLQIRNKKFHKDMKRLREASELLHQIIDKMHDKAIRGDYLK